VTKIKLNKNILYESLSRLRNNGEKRIYLSERTFNYITDLIKTLPTSVSTQHQNTPQTIKHFQSNESRLNAFTQSLNTIASLSTKEAQMAAFEKLISEHYANQNLLFGHGASNAEVFFLTECSNTKAIQRNALFSEKTSQLFDKILKAMGLESNTVYLSSLFKTQSTMNACTSGDKDSLSESLLILKHELAIINPKVLVCLGKSIRSYLFNETDSLSEAIEPSCSFFKFNNIDTICTFSPTNLVHTSKLESKRLFWDDMLRVMERLDYEISDKQKNYFKVASSN
jgi:uracil-DNA glycosylase family 4